MATVVQPDKARSGEESFFFVSACIMAAVIVAGFSLDLLLGRSGFGVPAVFHLHALFFFGWTAFYVLQNGLIAADHVSLHRRLGWLALAWLPVMMALGTVMTVISAKHGAPFFFDVNEFLVGNPLELYTFGGLALWAITVRRNTGWHRRLMFCSMALLTGPALGRMLPMPFMIPWAWWGTFAALMLFPVAGAIADRRRSGHVHPAWWAGMATMTLAMLVSDAIAYSPAGYALTHAVTDGTPGGARPVAAYLPWATPLP